MSTLELLLTVGVITTVVLLALFFLLPLPTCGKCSQKLPRVRKPETQAQALWGGWTCPNCGADLGRDGNPRTGD